MSKNVSSIVLGKDENIVEVFPRKSSIAKKIIISLNRQNIFELIVPKRASLKQAINFLHKHEDWVLKKNLQLKQKSRTKFENGAIVPILGKNYTIKHSGQLRGITKIEEEFLLVSGLEEHIGRKIKQFLIKQAKEEITLMASVYAKSLNVKFNLITLRDTSSRWGSCSHNGNLSFSWRVVMAPREVLQYLVAHEVSHLREMNHSKKFWNNVAIIFPQYKLTRNWLKIHGANLHSYDA